MAKIIDLCWGVRLVNDDTKPFECKSCKRAHEIIDEFDDDNILEAFQFICDNEYGITFKDLVAYRVKEGKPYSDEEIGIVIGRVERSIRAWLEFLKGM